MNGRAVSPRFAVHFHGTRYNGADDTSKDDHQAFSRDVSDPVSKDSSMNSETKDSHYMIERHMHGARNLMVSMVLTIVFIALMFGVFALVECRKPYVNLSVMMTIEGKSLHASRNR